MEIQLLRDENIFPSEDVLKNALYNLYPVYKELMDTIESEKYGLTHQWNYYKDGKAWLCKISYKKKTVIWLSVLENYFKIGIYFTDKSGAGIKNLDISKDIKKDYASNKTIGKLKPVRINVHDKNQLEDILTLVEYKKNIK